MKDNQLPERCHHLLPVLIQRGGRTTFGGKISGQVSGQLLHPTRSTPTSCFLNKLSRTTLLPSFKWLNRALGRPLDSGSPTLPQPSPPGRQGARTRAAILPWGVPGRNSPPKPSQREEKRTRKASPHTRLNFPAALVEIAYWAGRSRDNVLPNWFLAPASPAPARTGWVDADSVRPSAAVRLFPFSRVRSVPGSQPLPAPLPDGE